MNKTKVISAFAAGVLIMSLLAACGQGTDTGNGADIGDELALFVGEARRFHVDYEPSAGPVDLAAAADLVVSGRIVNAAAGQLYAPLPGEQPRIATTVLEIEVDEVLRGNPADVVRNTVYVEVAHPAFLSAQPEEEVDSPTDDIDETPYNVQAFIDSVPKLSGVFFLDDRTNEPYWETVIDSGTGRPAGAPLFAAFTDGFLLDDGGTVISVYERATDGSPWESFETVADIVQALRQ